jgi:DNA-binding transcriptional ArsR family regulator
VELDDAAATEERLPSSADPVPGAAELAVFAALADPTRWSVLETLLSGGAASATRLANRLPVSRQAVVKHLHVLEAAALVRGSRTGREVRYLATPGALEASARRLADLADLARRARSGGAQERTAGTVLIRRRIAGLPVSAVVPVLDPAVPDGRVRGPRR